MKAIGLHVVIKPINETELVAGGMETSESDKKKIRYKKGEVIAAGEQTENLSPKDIVLYDSASGHTALINGEQYTVMMHRDISVVL